MTQSIEEQIGTLAAIEAKFHLFKVGGRRRDIAMSFSLLESRRRSKAKPRTL
jgi:hypothetical protein